MNPFLHEWHNQTTLHPMGITMVLVLGTAMILVPRRYAMWPMIIMACFVSPAQRIVVATLDFDLMRLMVLFGWARLMMRGELKPLRLGALDAFVVLLPIWRVLSVIVLARDTSGVINKLGSAFDVIGVYFLFRFLIRDWHDAKHAFRGFVYVGVPVAMAFALEQATGRNLFAFFGGLSPITDIRDGRLRCQGAFPHPIMAGCFWASVLPLVACLWWQRGFGKTLAVVGSVSALLIVVTCASSTPALSVIFGACAACVFVMRRWMRLLRWSAAALLVALHVSMNAPVWHLITRVELVGGSTGYHRYRLIEAAIEHVDEWWAMGSRVGTAHWGAQMFDVTNYYLVQGLNGGVVQLALFVTIIALGFRQVGRILRAAGNDRSLAIAGWALGVALFIHTTNFLGVSYFGQILSLYYMTLGIIASIASPALATAPAMQPVEAARPEPIGKPRLVMASEEQWETEIERFFGSTRGPGKSGSRGDGNHSMSAQRR